MVLISYRLGQVVPPDELFVPEWIEAVRDSAHMSAMTELFAHIRDLIIAGQCGRDSALPDLVSYFDSLPDYSRAEAATYFFWAGTELNKGSVLVGQRAELMDFMYELAQHVPPADRLMLLLEGWETFQPGILNMEHRSPAAKWSRELLRLADVAWQADPSVANTYQVLLARLLDAKVRAMVEGDDMDDVVEDLRQRIEGFRNLDVVAAVALDLDLARLRAHIAQECGDGRAIIAHLAECVRLMVANPELNLGSRLVAAVNLIKAVNTAPLSEVRPFDREIAAAARIMLDDLLGVLGLGTPGVSALATLTQQSTAELARLEPDQVQLLAATVRARAPGPEDGHVRGPSGPPVTTRLGPLERSLSETLQICAHYHEQEQAEKAVVTLLEWLLINNGRPTQDHWARFHQCTLAMTLEKYVDTIGTLPEWMRTTARYTAGESARHAGSWTVAQQYLSIAYDEARSSEDPPIQADAIECDYAVLMIEIAADSGDRAEALRWLRLLFRNPLAQSPVGAIHLANAVTVFARQFGPADVESEAKIALRALLGPSAAESHPDPNTAIQLVAVQAELLIATGDTASLPALLPVLAESTRGLPPSFEASIRKTMISALVTLGDVNGVRTELDRLAFLQDEALGMTVQFDNHSYLDHLGDAHLMAAGAAADAQDIVSAVDMLERGRLRLLQRLQTGIDTAETSSREGNQLEPTSIWGQLLAAIEDEPSTGFGVAVKDWKHVFHDVGVPQVLEAAERAGVVAYQFIHADQLRMIYLLHGRSAFTAGPLDLKGLELFGDDEELLGTLARTWGSAIATCISRGFAQEDLSPILVSAGEKSELAVLNDLAFGVASQIELGERRLLYHLPSIRFAEPWEKDLVAPTAPVRLLHIGDASNTLLGPWLEAASLRAMDGLEVRSLLGGNSTKEIFEHHLPDVSVIVASCHGAYSQHDLLRSSLMVGAGGLLRRN